MTSKDAYLLSIEYIKNGVEIDPAILETAQEEHITEINAGILSDLFGIDEKMASNIIELNKAFGDDTFFIDNGTNSIYQYDSCYFMDSCINEIKEISSQKAYTLLFEADENGDELDPDLLKIAIWGGYKCDEFNREYTLLF